MPLSQSDIIYTKPAKGIITCPHPDQPYEARGMCRRCYRKWRREGGFKEGRLRASYAHERQSAECHPERSHQAHGLCHDCYERWRYHDGPTAAELHKQKRDYQASLPVEKKRELHLKHAYGLSMEDYERLFSAQGGVCLLCDLPPKEGRTLTVDHDHETGVIRGLLCHYCNRSIAQAERLPDWLDRVRTYLYKEDT